MTFGVIMRIIFIYNVGNTFIQMKGHMFNTEQTREALALI